MKQNKKQRDKDSQYARQKVQLQLPGQPAKTSLAKDALKMAENFTRQHQWGAAGTIAQQLTRQLPRFSPAWLVQFNVINTLADFALLEKAARDCLQHLPRFIPALVSLATALRMQQRQSEAMEYLQAALKLEPANARLHNHIGILQKELGEFESALLSFNRCIKIEPLYADAYWNRADIYTDVDQQDINAMQKTLKHPKLKPASQVKMYYALARAYELLGNSEEQFACIDAGAKIKRATLEHDHKAEIEETQRIASVFTNDLLSRLNKTENNHSENSYAENNDTQGSNTADKNTKKTTTASRSTTGKTNTDSQPIFICGLPRSGTTLVEQILSSHPDVNAGGEINALPLATSEILRQFSIDRPFPDWAADFDQKHYSLIGERYHKLTSPLKNKPFFTDKNLQNYKAIGLIRLALPQARIIFCRRDPMDIIWGCYRQLFSGGLPFTYSLDELADTVMAAQDLLSHWQDILGEQLYVLDYETLVTNQKQSTEELLNFVGLEWNDACLVFYNNPRAVQTTSASQVRSPISQQRIGQWKNFEEQLKPIHKKLLSE